jgi:aspartate aminotransferase
MLPLSHLARQIKPSATLAAGALAKQLRAQGITVYDFSLGEPDFPTPPHICQAAAEAVAKGATRYTPSSGLPELRRALAERYEKLYGLGYTPEQLVVTSGAKHALHIALCAVLNPGDEVLLPAPYWTSYADLIEMTGAAHRAAPATLDQQFKLTPDQLRRAVTPRSRVLILNSPANPTGSVYTKEELLGLGEVAVEKDLIVLSDEIYECLTYDGHPAHCFAALRPEFAARTVTVSGASKTYSMTGWRMGWAAGPREIIDAMGSLQSQETGCPSSVSQAAALAAVTGDQSCVEAFRRELETRRNLVCDLLGRIPGVKFARPQGAFYIFFDVSSHFGRTLGGAAVNDSAAFCKSLLEAARVNLVPGSSFGAEGFVRLSYATGRQQIEAGLAALAKFLAS